MYEELDPAKLEMLYSWIDGVPLSRPKKSLTRDFSDGVMVAELLQHFLPKLVDMHNYSPANSSSQKMNNWGVLQRRVFSKLKFAVPEPVVRSVCNCKPGVVEIVLLQLKASCFIASTMLFSKYSFIYETESVSINCQRFKDASKTYLCRDCILSDID